MALLGAAACTPISENNASLEEVARAAYRADGPATVTLFTMVNNRSNEGAHSALMVSGSERVIFDPAGTWYHPQLPERGDAHYGIQDSVVDFFIDYHARVTYRVVRHEVQVTQAQADQILANVRTYGTVGPAFCTNAISQVLRGVPGFEQVGSTFFPKRMMRNFSALPGATERVYRDDDPDNKDFVRARHLRLN